MPKLAKLEMEMGHDGVKSTSTELDGVKSPSTELGSDLFPTVVSILCIVLIFLGIGAIRSLRFRLALEHESEAKQTPTKPRMAVTTPVPWSIEEDNYQSSPIDRSTKVNSLDSHLGEPTVVPGVAML